MGLVDLKKTRTIAMSFKNSQLSEQCSKYTSSDEEVHVHGSWRGKPVAFSHQAPGVVLWVF